MTFAHARKSTMTLGKWFAAAGAAVALGLAQPALAADYVIRLSHGMPEALSSGQHAWALVFKETTEARSAGNSSACKTASIRWDW
jgi:TRAP-type C4-dicarboxylate transport system substrate-binding protein